MSPVNGIALEIAIRFAALLLLLGSTGALVYGIGLMLGSRWVFRLNDWSKRWVSTRQVMRKLEEPRDVEARLFGAHRWAGLAITLASAYVLATLLLKYDVRTLLGALFGRAPHWAAELALRSGWTLLVLGGAAGLLLGLSLALKPGALRRFQETLNRYYSARRATKFLEVMNLGPDQWISSYPRASGAVITLGSLYIAYSLGVVVISRV